MYDKDGGNLSRRGEFTDTTYQTHNVFTQCRCNVTTLQRRCKDVDATLCVCWVSNLHVKSTTLGQPTHIYPRPVEPSYALPLQIV